MLPRIFSCPSGAHCPTTGIPVHGAVAHHHELPLLVVMEASRQGTRSGGLGLPRMARGPSGQGEASHAESHGERPLLLCALLLLGQQRPQLPLHFELHTVEGGEGPIVR